jgi:hypothetical protein
MAVLVLNVGSVHPSRHPAVFARQRAGGLERPWQARAALDTEAGGRSAAPAR